MAKFYHNRYGNLESSFNTDAFGHLPRLEVLTLNDNQIRRFSKEAFPGSTYKSITRISISGNPVSLFFSYEFASLFHLNQEDRGSAVFGQRFLLRIENLRTERGLKLE